MKPAPLPDNEADRLDRLRRYRILDTPAEDPFDRITRIVAETIDVPIALVSLVDEARQWFKSRYGLDATETPRDLAFCAHAILDTRPLVVEDASRDERFFDNPLVASDPSIRFYAGAPLKTADGFNLGTLCAIDRRPRKLNERHRQLLEDLARLVVDEMELRISLQGAMDRLAEETRGRAMKDEFFAMISHELRTPLTSIRGALGLLDNGVAGELPGKAGDLVSMAHHNTLTLLTLINDLLDMQKLEAGKLQFSFTSVDVEELLRATCADLEGLAPEKGVSLDLVCKEVPAIVADACRLRQALTNLISNAVKFSPSGAAVMVACSCRGNEVCLEVSDQGAGIPEDFLPNLFDRFSQSEAGARKGGTGLGLAITRAIVEAHDGRIEVDTALGAGTTFRLLIPVERTLA